VTGRLRPIPVEKWPSELIAALPSMAPAGATPLEAAKKAKGALGMLAHHPDLASAWLQYNAQVLRATTLSVRHRELLILRVTAVRKAVYNWAEHVPIARRCGLDDEEIARVAFGPDAPLWDPLDAALLRSVDELVADGAVTDDTWTIVAKHLDARQQLDLLFVVGAYETIGWMSRTFALEPDIDTRLGPKGTNE
jgi:alkylhydroperoxidase family enzyme